MICRRRLQRLRSRNTLALMIVTALFVGIFVTYKTLNVQDNRAIHGSSLPTLDKVKKSRYQAAHSKHKLFADRSQIRTNLNLQFNSGRKLDGVRDVLSTLYPTNWKSATEPDEVAIMLKDKMLDLNLNSLMSCREISEYQILGSLGSSNRKYVEKLEEPQNSLNSFDSYNSRERNQKKHQMLAIKSQAHDVPTKIACMKQVYNADFCGPMGNYLLMREIFLLRFLQHPSLINLLGYCLRGDRISMDMRKKGVVLVMEAGIPLVPSMVVSMSFARRVQLALDVASLLEYLQSSPLGSVGLPHVQLKDFVLVDHKTVKLTDLDEAQLEERTCSKTPDCYLLGSDVGVECQNGHCLGLNQKTNMRVIGSYVLEIMLRNSPPEEQTRVEEMLSRIRRLDVSPTELVNFLDALVEKYSVKLKEEAPVDSEGYQRLKNKADKHFNNHLSARDRDEDEDEDEEEEDEEVDGVNRNNDKRPIPWKGKTTLEENPQPENYLRLDSSNFPGQYDYPCPDSRVLWGCVMTFNSIESAMQRCSSDTSCKSFVIFSSQPEHESKMTVVFKNKGTGSPHVNLGTTLFIQRKGRQSDQDPPIVNNGMEDNNVPQQDQADGGAGKEEENVKQDPWAKVKEMQECVKRSRGNQEEALRSREKRLMAHMGLKGKQEKDWKRAVRIQSVTGYSSLQGLSGQGEKGGTVFLHFNTSTAGHTISRAKFMVEKGQKKNHIAFALVYHIDRLLGLYHTPPVVESFIPATVVEKFTSDPKWQSTFGSLTHSDGTLRGLFVAPTPKVVKRSEVTLQPLLQMVPEVTSFDRTQKVQLEYVLLWWLGHIAKPGDLHFGFKGHLIHVDGDQGFQEPAVNYDGYLNHCQFPNVVYKMLMCFRCHQGSSNRICFLGQEVVRRLEAAGFRLSDLHIQDLTEQDYPALINGAASKTVEIVDKCIKNFGRESVLY